MPENNIKIYVKNSVGECRLHESVSGSNGEIL
jgi:hypothetical protein